MHITKCWRVILCSLLSNRSDWRAWSEWRNIQCEWKHSILHAIEFNEYSTFYRVQDPNRQRNLDETIESSTDVTSIEQNTVANVNATITNIETNNKSSAEQTHKTHKRNARRERFLLDTLLSRKKLYKVLIDKMDKWVYLMHHHRWHHHTNLLYFAGLASTERNAYSEQFVRLPNNHLAITMVLWVTSFISYSGVYGGVCHWLRSHAIHSFINSIDFMCVSPSSSRSEKLSIDYYEAEQDGQNGRCHRYKTLCSFGILELITQTTVQ